jgi:hypothetical protein
MATALGAEKKRTRMVRQLIWEITLCTTCRPFWCIITEKLDLCPGKVLAIALLKF